MQPVLIVVTAIALLALPAPAVAAGKPGQGRAIAAEHCVKCHAIPDYSDNSGLDIAPTFAALAAELDGDGEARFRRFLARPHWPMRQFTLSPSDIDNIVAFMQSLRP